MASSLAPTSASSDALAPPLADWFSLRLFGQYRMVMLVALAAVYHISNDQRTLGTRDPSLFEAALLGYAGVALACLVGIRWRHPGAQTQSHLQSYADIVFVVLLSYASGGVQSGLLGPWLLVNMALLSHFNPLRHALLFAAIATLTVLVGELVAISRIGTRAADLERTALLGSLLFAVAWLMSVPVRQLAARRMSATTEERAGLDVRQIAELNEEIVRELGSGVVVTDAARQVLLVNDTARTLLAAEFGALPRPLSALSDSLHASVREAMRSSTGEVRPFTIESTGQSVLPSYVPLSNGGLLIRLDDQAHIRQQLQQLKLASLGRLSASIAHEIRNPLGAISHAVQLIEESATLEPPDAELLAVARRHTLRIDRIVNDVLQLSNRRRVRPGVIDLGRSVHDFCERFRDENALTEASLTCTATVELHAVFDHENLDQVLWNLCTNARRHNEGRDVTINIACLDTSPESVAIEVRDDGAGISDLDREHLFEPFYSTHHGGSGLGLYIISELCELNRATIECVRAEHGACFRLSLPRAGQMTA